MGIRDCVGFDEVNVDSKQIFEPELQTHIAFKGALASRDHETGSKKSRSLCSGSKSPQRRAK